MPKHYEKKDLSKPIMKAMIKGQQSMTDKKRALLIEKLSKMKDKTSLKALRLMEKISEPVKKKDK